MAVLGHFRSSTYSTAMSTLPRLTGIVSSIFHVQQVPTSEVISLIRSPLGRYGLLEKPGMLGHCSDYRDPQRIRRFFPAGESYASSSFHLGSTTFDLHTSRR